MTAASATIPRVPTGLLIGSDWTAAEGERTIDVLDPADGSGLAAVADASPRDGAAAMDAAAAAQPGWERTPALDRAEILRRAFELVTEHREDLALMITLEMGKPLAESRGEVAYGAEFLRWFSQEATRISGRFTPAPDGGPRLLTTRAAVGPCLLITPWNFPLAMVTRKVAAAVAAGCTMVLKPSELTPLTALLFADLVRRAGLPDGVLNVLTTTDPAAVTGPLLVDPRLRKLSFTGSTRTGSLLLRTAACRVLRTSMELGGNAPFLVFEDADLDAAVDGAVLAKMRNGGQACVAANRFLVHESVASEFTGRLAERLDSFVTGPGTRPGVTLGPLINEAAVEKVDELVRDALERGARAVVGGARESRSGTFYPGTVLSDVPRDARVLHEEVFGPVAPVTTFHSEEEAIATANHTDYGLVSFAYTRDLARGLRLAERLESGMVGLNTGVVSNPAAPFGGVKASGLGREGGVEGIEEYLETRYVAIGNPYQAIP